MTAMRSNDSSFFFKVGVVGKPGAGRASLLRAIEKEPFIENLRYDYKRGFGSNPYNSYNFVSSEHQVNANLEESKTSLVNKKVKLQWHSELSNNSWARNTEAACKGAAVVILIYDITNFETFNDILALKKKIEGYISENVSFVLVGNKCEMEDLRVISREDGALLAEKNGMSFVEISVKNGTNMDGLIATVLKQAFKSSNLKVIENKSEEKAPSEEEVIKRVRALDKIEDRNKLVSEWVALGKGLKDPAWGPIRARSVSMLVDEASKLDPIKKNALLNEALNWPLFNVHRGSGLKAVGKTSAVKKILAEISKNQSALELEAEKQKENEARSALQKRHSG